MKRKGKHRKKGFDIQNLLRINAFKRALLWSIMFLNIPIMTLDQKCDLLHCLTIYTIRNDLIIKSFRNVLLSKEQMSIYRVIHLGGPLL